MPPMALHPDDRLGPYVIVGVLGAGGMGEVLRARDPRLGRDVAVKILPAALASDSERLARFDREARTLAALNHPNIAQIYGVEEIPAAAGEPSGRALVMELVEGPTLADRLARGPMPLDEALAVARQIADALGTAHALGVVHRDLKPANVKLRADGMVKVLDFGLATGAAGRAAVANDIDDSPTITAQATRAGVILGTAAYMAPEQAKGRPVDARADVWAFGVVLYEMLTGRRAFGGHDVSEVLASVLKDTPSMAALPPETPPSVRRLLRRCLEKDPSRRLASMADARLEIDDAGVAEAPAGAPRRASAATVLPWVAAALAAGALLTWALLSRGSAPAAAPVAFQELPPRGTQFALSPLPSPDGRHLALVAVDSNNGSDARLWTRDIGDPALHAVEQSDGVLWAFWSPDSSQLAFVAGGQVWRVAASGGTPALVIAANPTTGVWLADGDLLLAIPGQGLMRVPAAGGSLRAVAGFNAPSLRDLEIFGLDASPDGRYLLFTQFGGETGIYVSHPDGTDKRRLYPGEQSAAVFAGSDLIVRQRAGVLVAQRVNASDMTLVGDSFPIAPNVGGDQFAAGANGALSYVSGSAEVDRLTWFTRDGKPAGTAAPEGIYSQVAISRNGHWLGFVRQDPTDGNIDVWMQPAAGGPANRLTSDPDIDHLFSISPDEREVAWEAHAGGSLNLMRRPADGSTAAQMVRVWGRAGGTSDWSPDGRDVLYGSIDGTSSALWLVPADGSHDPWRLTPAGVSASEGRFSPDGRWLAFDGTATGADEVYLQRFDGGTLSGGPIRVSQNGGSLPIWRRDGRELYFINHGTIMAVDVTGSGDQPAGMPHALFSVAGLVTGSYGPYAVTPDGQRFIAIVGTRSQTPLPATVVLGWKPTARR
jgi:eukaryotic-like serine/threonine-protein kinase